MTSRLVEMCSPTATLRADSIGKEADLRLRGGPPNAFVHSSYDGAVNVMTGFGLVCFVPPSTGRGPINVTVSGDFHLLSMSATRGDAVTMAEAEILVGSGPPVSLVGSKVYNPSWKFSRGLLGDGFIRRNLQLARETAIVQGSFSGMGSLLYSLRGEELSASSLGLNLYSTQVLRHLIALVRGLGDEDVKGVKVAAKNIVGLGVGLTPSADDVLSGLMVALVLCVKNGLANGSFYLRASRAIAETSVGRSATLSQEFLEQASMGRSNEKVTRLVESICAGSPSEVVGSTSDLIAMGHSSGTDTTIGVILGIGFMLKKNGRRRIA